MHVSPVKWEDSFLEASWCTETRVTAKLGIRRASLIVRSTMPWRVLHDKRIVPMAMASHVELSPNCTQRGGERGHMEADSKNRGSQVMVHEAPESMIIA
jgi:hypothetical protein